MFSFSFMKTVTWVNESCETESSSKRAVKLKQWVSRAEGTVELNSLRN